VLRVPAGEATALVARLVTLLQVTDITVADPPLEEVIERVFAGEALSAERDAPLTASAGDG
jgi:ABC-type uncharacterized transport system ATPase subunit